MEERFKQCIHYNMDKFLNLSSQKVQPDLGPKLSNKEYFFPILRQQNSDFYHQLDTFS